MRDLKRARRGQMQLSFGMIFSIIVVIATVGIGFYVINHFMSLSRCTEVGLFKKSLQDEINKAWEGDIIQKTFSGDAPSGIKKVCFGNVTQMPINNKDIFEEIWTYGSKGQNFYFYPMGKACEMPSAKLEHMKTSNFFCVNERDGKISVKLTKGTSDALVTLAP